MACIGVKVGLTGGSLAIRIFVVEAIFDHNNQPGGGSCICFHMFRRLSEPRDIKGKWWKKRIKLTSYIEASKDSPRVLVGSGMG